jgi:hypothetical protein
VVFVALINDRALIDDRVPHSERLDDYAALGARAKPQTADKRRYYAESASACQLGLLPWATIKGDYRLTAQ